MGVNPVAAALLRAPHVPHERKSLRALPYRAEARRARIVGLWNQARPVTVYCALTLPMRLRCKDRCPGPVSFRIS